MKILVIQARPGIGDMCLFLPFIHQIAKYNNSKITILTKERCQAKHLIINDPFIDEIIYIQKKFNYKFFKYLRLKNFDCVYIFHYGFKFILLSKFIGISNIFSYGVFKKNSNISQEPKKFLKKWFNKKRIIYQCKIFFKKNNFNKNNIIIGIGGSGETKKWHIENYLKLIKKIISLKKKYTFLIAGGHYDLKNYLFLQKKLNYSKFISLCEMNISEAMKKIVSSKIYIGNDTGFMHISGMLGVKTYGLFGDTPTAYAEYNNIIKPIIPRGYSGIGHDSLAMNDIDVDLVFSKIKKEIS